MRIRVLSFFPLLAFAFTFGYISFYADKAAAQTDLYDCSDFTYQEEAQAQLLPGDPYGLDADNDGMACDTLPSGGTTSGGTPIGGGDGGGDLDCANFATQEEAQTVLERNPSDPNGLDADNDGIACEELAGNGGGGGDRELDCADFATHGEAQRELARDPTDPYNLDADDDGIACEELRGNVGGGDPIGSEPEDTTPADDQYTPNVPPGDVNDPKDVVPGTGARQVPSTGGLPRRRGAVEDSGAGRRSTKATNWTRTESWAIIGEPPESSVLGHTPCSRAFRAASSARYAPRAICDRSSSGRIAGQVA